MVAAACTPRWLGAGPTAWWPARYRGASGGAFHSDGDEPATIRARRYDSRMTELLILFTILSIIIGTAASVVAARAYRMAEKSEVAARIGIGHASQGDAQLQLQLLREQGRVDQIIRLIDMMAKADLNHLQELRKTFDALIEVDRSLLAVTQRTDLDVRHLHALQDTAGS